MAFNKKEYAKQWRLKNYEKRIKWEREWRKNDHVKKYKKEYLLKNKEKINKKKKEYYQKNNEKIKTYHKLYREKNREKRRAYCQTESYKKYKKAYDKIYRANNRKHKNKYLRDRRKNDPNFKLVYYLRTGVKDALKGRRKSKPTLKLLGCTIEELWKHFESNFQPGMTRENHGRWHIDHIRPCASFNLSDPEQQQKCFHYTNLQPLWAIDNMKKGSKIISGDITSPKM